MKLKKETAAEAFERFNSLKRSNASAELLAKVLSIANALMDEQFKRTQDSLDSKFAGSDWWEAVKKFYKVEEHATEGWRVISLAKDWKEEKEWNFPTKYEALEQLEKLIKYKATDRKKGRGSIDKDFEKLEALAA
jgi:hypothetical protein